MACCVVFRCRSGLIVFEAYKVDPTQPFEYQDIEYRYAPVSYRTNPGPGHVPTSLRDCTHVTMVKRPVMLAGPGSEPKPRAPAATKPCPVCTYENPGTRTHCEICESPL